MNSSDSEPIWRTVVGSDGKFEVSNHGTVRKVATGKAVTLTPNDRGYICCGVSQDGHRKVRKVHIMVAEAFIGPRPDGQELSFIDGVKANCALSNLRYGTAKAHAAERLRQEGATAASARLTRDEVLKIREKIAAGIRFSRISDEFGISYGNVKKISQRVTWDHL